MTTEKRETVSLIGSDKVQGTAVYGPDGEKIGSIERVMIEKISGKEEQIAKLQAAPRAARSMRTFRTYGRLPSSCSCRSNTGVR